MMETDSYLGQSLAGDINRIGVVSATHDLLDNTIRRNCLLPFLEMMWTHKDFGHWC